MCSNNPYVTVMNDASLTDGQGAVHTWLIIGCPGTSPIVFSFSNSDNTSLVGFDSPGKSSAADMSTRTPSEKHTIGITTNQYNVLKREVNTFYDHHPKYDLTPDNEGDFNCVTAARTLLQLASIDYLNNIQTPFGVKQKIRNGISNGFIEGILQMRDDFDANNKEVVRYFEIFVTKGFDSKDILTQVMLNARRPIAIPYGSRNEDVADFYLNVGDGNTPLHKAVRFPHIEIVKFECESKGANANAKNAFDNTPAHFAARYGNLDILKYLVEQKGADANAKSRLGSTPLHYAALGGHLPVVQYLMDVHRADQNAMDETGLTPLHAAASSGNVSLMRYLLSKGGNANAETRAGDTVLSFAVSKGGNLNMVNYLIQNGAIVTLHANGPTTLHYACLGGHLDIVRALIDTHRINVNDKSYGIHTLHYAVRGGNLDIVKYLVEQKGCNVNELDNVDGTPLHDAAQRGNFSMVRYLLQHGATPIAKNKLNEMPIDVARSKHHSDTVKCLESVQTCVASRVRRSANIGYGQYNAIDFAAFPADTAAAPILGEVDVAGNALLLELFMKHKNGVNAAQPIQVETLNSRLSKHVDDAQRMFDQAMQKEFIE